MFLIFSAWQQTPKAFFYYYYYYSSFIQSCFLHLLPNIWERCSPAPVCRDARPRMHKQKICQNVTFRPAKKKATRNVPNKILSLSGTSHLTATTTALRKKKVFLKCFSRSGTVLTGDVPADPQLIQTVYGSAKHIRFQSPRRLGGTHPLTSGCSPKGF